MKCRRALASALFNELQFNHVPNEYAGFGFFVFFCRCSWSLGLHGSWTLCFFLYPALQRSRAHVRRLIDSGGGGHHLHSLSLPLSAIITVLHSRAGRTRNKAYFMPPALGNLAYGCLCAAHLSHIVFANINTRSHNPKRREWMWSRRLLRWPAEFALFSASSRSCNNARNTATNPQSRPR